MKWSSGIMTNTASANDNAWEKFFKDRNITPSQNMYLSVDAKEMKEYREPRLMAKFDHKVNLPKIFRDYSLSILPTARGKYIIACFDDYHRLEALNGEIIQNMLPPDNLQSLNIGNITSETVALNFALAAGIVENFLGEEYIFPTVCGRMGSGCFDFKTVGTSYAGEHKIFVENAQIEIDAAYEGINSLAIFEAKINIPDDSDFLIRQLYYPFRVWENRITKPIRSVFLTYSNGIYTLREYSFPCPEIYNEIKLVKQARYSIEDTTIEIHEIEEVLDKTIVQPEPKEIPFPQADSFTRIINLCEILKTRESMSVDEITQLYDFDRRQAFYYTSAALYLKLLKKPTGSYCLTDKAKAIVKMHYKERQLALCACIFSSSIFRTIMQQYLQSGQMPSQEEIINVMQNAGVSYSDDTMRRRASTTRSWLNWVAALTQP